jgi:hypothetical protein
MTLKTNSIDWTIERDGTEIDVAVAYQIEPFVPAKTYGPPEDCYPAEGGYISDIHVTVAGVTIDLTADEMEQFETYVIDHADEDEGPDPDYLRDIQRDEEWI